MLPLNPISAPVFSIKIVGFEMQLGQRLALLRGQAIVASVQGPSKDWERSTCNVWQGVPWEGTGQPQGGVPVAASASSAVGSGAPLLQFLATAPAGILPQPMWA